MSWQERAGKKLMSPDEAVAAVESGHCVTVAPFTSTPATLCEALYRRRRELRNVRIDHPAGLHSWVRDGDGGSFEVHEMYGTVVNRDMVNRGRLEYLPLAVWRVGELPSGFNPAPDAFLVAVSPPDARGFCSFGSGVWFSKLLSENAKTVIAEVHEDFMRTGGDNFVHLSRLDRICLAEPAPPPPVPPRNEEEAVNTEVICRLVAAELVHDRDTLQIGVGTVAAAVGMYLGDKHDLGIQTELVTDGIATFLRDGVITGKYKTLHAGKVVGSACTLLSKEELAILDGHPAFELYDFGYTDDVRFLVRQNNLVAINNALLVDLTGQVASETIGPRIWTGGGGQLAFMIAAQYSPGGRSISVLPSSHVLGGKRVSRVVGALPEGTAVTVPRTLVDYVVTEQGIASLRGKTIRERIGELVAVAHPDFRAELREQAKRLYGIG